MTTTMSPNPTTEARTLTTRKGRSITTALSDTQALDICRGLTASSFAQDLVAKAERYGLSYDQWAWVHILANEEVRPADQAPAPVGLTNGARIVALFASAREHLARPAIAVTVGEVPLRLAVAGEQSRYPGQVQVTDGGDWDSRRYYGRIDAEGTFHAGRDCTGDVIRALERFAGDPAGVAAEHGRLTGNCCFCRRELTDPRSTSVGYGPICAGRFGLPWGGPSA